MIDPGCSTCTTRPRYRPGMASFERSALEETCAASATGILPPSILRQLRRVECMCRASNTLLVHGNTGRKQLPDGRFGLYGRMSSGFCGEQAPPFAVLLDQNTSTSLTSTSAWCPTCCG